MPAFATATAPIVLLFVEFLLLIGCKQRTNLGLGVVHDGFGFLHRIPVDLFHLRLRFVEDWLDFRLLLRREVERVGQFLHRIVAHAAAAVSAAPLRSIVRLVLRQRRAAEGESGESCE